MPGTNEPTQNPSEPPLKSAPELASSSPIPPGLVLVATPIGNLGDVSARALAALRGAELVLCEDTRTTPALLTHYGIAVPTSPLHEHNEQARIPACSSGCAPARRSRWSLTPAPHSCPIPATAGARGGRRRACPSPACPGPTRRCWR